MSGVKLPPLDNKFKGSELNLSCLIKNNNDTIFINEKGFRKSLIFKTQNTYSFTDVVDMLSKLDKLWEDTKSGHNYYT